MRHFLDRDPVIFPEKKKKKKETPFSVQNFPKYRFLIVRLLISYQKSSQKQKLKYAVCWGVILSKNRFQGAIHQDFTGNNYSTNCLKPTISQKLFL